MCCKSQDISCGMRKIGKWSDHFGTEIALGRGASDCKQYWPDGRLLRCTTWGFSEGLQPLLFDGLRQGHNVGHEVNLMRRER